MTLWRPFLILRLGILAACAALIVISAVPVVRHMAGIVLVAHQPLPPLPRQAPATAIDLAPIFALAPFGRPPVANQPPDSTGQSRPDLRLKGIFAAASEGSVALIEVVPPTLMPAVL